MKKYQIIYADPPWRYEHPPIGSKGRAIERHCATMSLEDIKLLEIPSEDNSVLFLWATAPKLKECLEVMNVWGYLYRTCAVWDKEMMGMGYWFRNQHEILLIGLKGKFSPPIPQMRERSVYREKRTKHSKKPNYFRDLITKWYPNKTKLEMFAREDVNIDLWGKNTFDGWDVWGNEVESDIKIKGEEK